MVVVDDLHIVYRVYGAGGDKGTAATALLRILGRKTRGSCPAIHGTAAWSDRFFVDTRPKAGHKRVFSSRALS